MKLLHLSDLHLGRTLGGVSLLEDQRDILTQILSLIDTVRPDAVLVAGDVYDRSNPAEEAVRLADWWIGEVSARGVPLCIISGNHDSAGRIAYLASVAARTGVYLPRVIAPGSPGLTRVTLSDAHGPVDITLLPFVRPATVHAALPKAQFTGTAGAVAALLAATPPRPGVRSVLVAHQLVLAGGAGPEPGGSEELLVGGVENVDAALFDAYHYVALGHIHRPQNVRGPRIRYCGAPLQYAKDEAGQARGATLVEMDAAGAVTVQAVPLRPLHPVWQIRGRLEALLAPGFGPGQQAQDYFFVTLTDETPPAAPMDRLRAKYPNVLGLELDRDAGGAAGQAQRNAAAAVAGKTLQALFGEFFESRNGRPMNGAEAAALAAVLEKRREEAPQ